jgi:hypothetical protein
MRLRTITAVVSSFVLAHAILSACSSPARDAFPDNTNDGASDAGNFSDVVPDNNVLPAAPPDPKTCEEAKTMQSYIGCDYWPTITSNVVADVFDYAVAVANVGGEPANIKVTGNGVDKSVVVEPGSLQTIYLPWVRKLKGDEDVGLAKSIIVRKGAYHLVSDKPVVVYQFNPLEFKAAGGEPGKDWSKCKKADQAPECYSYSNDASLLLPSTAMTGAYRVMGDYGFSHHPYNDVTGSFDTTKALENNAATAFTITATTDNTHVEIKLGPYAGVVGTVDPPSDAGTDADPDAGDGGDVTPDEIVDTIPARGYLTLLLNQGDVAAIVTGMGNTFDFSGAVVHADNPVQVITSVPCQFLPLDTFACDHVEETVFPAQTLGKHYIVTQPTGPFGNAVPHNVRIYGNEDDTTLTYYPNRPAGCPQTMKAGEAFECAEVSYDFEVTGDKAFGVGMFMLGGARVDPAGMATARPQGDPSQSFAVAVEQYREKYVFLAPIDYNTRFVDIVSGPDTKIQLDDVDITDKMQPLVGSVFTIGRADLPPTNGGVHRIVATRPVGIQVLGYGDNTSFQYPGGLNLAPIAPPPK